MELKNQVVSLELAKLLTELGVKQESVFYWVNSELATHGTSIPSLAKYGNGAISLWDNPEDEHRFRQTPSIYPAFTVAELGEMLKWKYASGFVGPENRYRGAYVCDVYRFNSNYPQYANTEADARAKMLIYLIENGLYDPQK